jgi:hypothetical protein
VDDFSDLFHRTGRENGAFLDWTASALFGLDALAIFRFFFMPDYGIKRLGFQ